MCGAAKLLPVATVVPPSFQPIGTSTPHAPTSTRDAGLDKNDSGSSNASAATKNTDEKVDGKLRPGTLLTAQMSATCLKYASSTISWKYGNRRSLFDERLRFMAC